MRWVLPAFAGVFLFPLAASAQEDGDLRLMHEPFSWVDVADAFDDDDAFDLNVRVAFRNEYTYGNIQRERGSLGPSMCPDMRPPPCSDPHRAANNWVDIAHFTHVRNILDIGLDVGIFRDLALFARMPLILSDTRSLGRVSGGPDPALFLRADPGDPPGGDPTIFSVPFDSPTRSGLDYIEAGLMWSIFNQHRERELPTWVLRVSGRFNVGDPLIACDGNGGGTNCREWTESSGNWTFRDGGTDAGETRGTNALRIETRASWRAGYVEPYAGLMFSIEWPANAERFFLPAGNIDGFINSQPPILGQFTGGIAIIPWEDRSAFQRFAIDLRFMGKYTSEGHHYSALFDALGTSDSPYLTNVNIEGEPSNPRASDLRQVPFFGLTDVQPYAELGMRVALEMRAARFVWFQLGLGLWYIQPHIITYTDACNPNEDPIPATPGPDGMLGTPDDIRDPRAGTCRRGIINPHHRPVIDLPGRTFRQDESVRIETQFRIMGMF